KNACGRHQHIIRHLSSAVIPPTLLLFFFFSRHADHRDLHSFPTRRSSDLAEIALHFPGPGNLDKPHLLVFPRILVCLNCGSAGFTVPESQLHTLADEMMPSRGESKTA